MLKHFLSGAICMASFTIALFFFRFWRRTSDRLFLIFSAAFLLLMAERIILVAVGSSHEFVAYVYLVRLLAFALIIFGIIDKNRKGQA
ncbi:MAG: hypothetical protein H0W20_01355 [Chthoniobacterales bacterium]|jgi:hypothetical protein|nr:hypothetical protein [Chthoniobacterales bacterium]